MADEKTEIQNEVVHSHPDYVREISDALKSTPSPKVLRDLLARYHASDMAEALLEIDDDSRQKLLRALTTIELADIMEYLDIDDMARMLQSLHIKKAIALINEMDADTASRLLEKMTPSKRSIILDLLDSDKRQDIILISSFGKRQIGSYLSTDYLMMPKTVSVKEAMRSLRHQAADNDNISTLFFEDTDGTFYGALPLVDLFKARANQDLSEEIQTNFPFVYASDPIDEVLQDLKDYGEDLIPVLNSDNSLLGVITRPDLLDLYDREMGQDYAQFTGMAAQEDLEEPLSKSLKKRLPWLLVLLCLSLGVSTVVSLFEHVVAQLTIVVVFQSLVLDMAGNVGTQSLAVSIRVLADEDLNWKEKLYLIGKECRVGFLNGIILGTGSALVLGVFIHFSAGFTWPESFAVSLCVGVAMVVSMLVSSLTGTTIPIALQAMNLDPAAASGPLITTLNDLIGVITYYGMAWAFLINMLHL